MYPDKQLNPILLLLLVTMAKTFRIVTELNCPYCMQGVSHTRALLSEIYSTTII